LVRAILGRAADSLTSTSTWTSAFPHRIFLVILTITIDIISFPQGNHHATAIWMLIAKCYQAIDPIRCRKDTPHLGI